MNSKSSAQNFAENSSSDQKSAFLRISPVAWLFFLAAIHLIGPFLPVPSAVAAILGGVLLTAIYVGAIIAFALGVAIRQFSIGAVLAWFALCVAVWIAVERGFLPHVNRGFRLIYENGGAPTIAQQFLLSYTTTIQDLALLGGATFAGTLLARLIRHANMIGPIGAAIALIDIWGVLFGGIVSQMLSNAATQPLAEKAMTAGPSLGAQSGAQSGFSISLPAIGVGDFLFIALLLSVLVNLAMNWKTSARLMWIFICAALLAIQFLPFFPALPGLLFISAATLLPNWKFFKFTREEQFALLYAGIFVLILTIGLYFGFQAMLPTPK